jgi:hypothetical protein
MAELWHLMIVRFVLCLSLLALVGLGCGRHSHALSLVREIGINELRNDLIVTVSANGTLAEIPQSAWPDSVKRFQPLAVERHMGGVLIVTSRSGRKQEGLLVMLDSEDDPGGGGSGVIYDKIRSDGVFWCIEKIRVEYIPPEQQTNK